MTFNQIKYFIKVAECLSFTEAARCLFITQPALSRQIAVMEEELGTPLFVREKKRLKLTPGGLVLYNRLPALMEAYEEAVADASSANQGYEGALRVGVLDIYDITDVFTDLIRTFQEENPAIRVALERFSLGELPRRLQQGNLDVILTYRFSLYEHPDVLTAFFHTFQSCMMMNRAHPLAGEANLQLADLKNEMFIQLGPQASEEGYQYLLHLCSRAGFTPTIRQVDKMEDVLLWIQSRGGIAITTDCTTEKYYPDVTIRPIDMPEAKNHEVCIAWHKNNYNPAIALFAEIAEKFTQSIEGITLNRKIYSTAGRNHIEC